MKKNLFKKIMITGVCLLAFCVNTVSCKHYPESYAEIDFRKEMRNFVKEIGNYARNTAENKNSSFIVIPQNGQAVAWASDYDDEISSESENLDKILDAEYFASINGTGREDTFFGGANIDYTATPDSDSKIFQNWCDIYKNQTGADEKNITVLSIDYCNKADAAISFSKNNSKKYISFAALERNLNTIPELSVYNENSQDCTKLNDCKNFLYLLNYENFKSKDAILNAIKNTNYDAVIMDAFYEDNLLFTSEDIATLKIKANGGKRLIISYMSIGEAEDYRWYWNEIKNKNLNLKENKAWKGNYKLEFWNEQWKKIIYGSTDSYTGKILNCGFDGVYLDIIDAYEYFEDLVN